MIEQNKNPAGQGGASGSAFNSPKNALNSVKSQDIGDIIRDFEAAMLAAGLACDDEIILNGSLQRFDVRGDKQGSKNGYYVVHSDGFPAGMFGSWKTGQTFNWCSKKDCELTPSERQQNRQRIEAAKAARDADRAATHGEAAARAESIWNDATAAREGHTYLEGKGVKAHDLRLYKDRLVIPMRDSTGKLHSLQFIGPDGEKRFLTGGAKAGHYHMVGTPDGVGLVAEGYATAASLYEATGLAVAVAFDAGNLLPVAQAMRTKFPDSKILIACDDDAATKGNPGLTKAQAAAEAIGGQFVLPDFADNRPDKATDWNDLHTLAGLDEVKRQIEAALNQPPCNQIVTHFTQVASDTELKRLAALQVAEYEAQRKGAAERLGMRASVLDAEVKKIHRTNAAKNDEPFEIVDPWPHTVDGAALLDEIDQTIRRFIICEPETAIAASLWVTMTWLIDAVQVAPLAVITAPEMRCGKSQLLNLIGRLVTRPIAASAISPAALFRCIDVWQPTLLIDETDALLKENEELRGMLNAGHTRDSAYVIRAVAMGDDFKPQKFSVWGAKALCGIGTLATTIMDRAIILELRRKLPRENVERLRHANTNAFNVMVSKLARWTADNADAIANARPDLPDALNDRAQDNWEPLLAIADIAGGRWPQLARLAALKISSDESSESTGAELLADIKTAFEREAVSRLSTADLLNALYEDTEAPWGTYNRGKPLSARQLAKRLKGYGVVSKTIRLGAATAKGYELAQLDDAFARYLIAPPPLSVTTSQVAETPTYPVTDRENVTAQKVTETQKVTENPRISAGCDVVTHKTPEAEDEHHEWSATL